MLCLVSAASAQSPQPPGRGAVSAPFSVRISPGALRGIAPCSIFFDGLASDVREGTVHDARFEWTFADPGTTRPTEIGFCAAHVFERPGSFLVSLHVTDAKGNEGYASTWIDVLPFTGTTLHVSATQGNDANDGRTPQTAVRTYDRAFALLRSALTAGGRATAVRVLFKRGESFSTATAWGFPVGTWDGPIWFGAYGDGALPIVRQTGVDPLVFGHDRVSGIRVTDLDLRGSYDITTRQGGVNQQLIGITGGSGHLVHRCLVRGSDYGIALAGDPRTPRSDFTISECAIEDVRSYAAYLGGDRIAVLGSRLARIADMHVLRLWYARKAVVVGNELLDPSMFSGRGLHALKLHAHAGGSQGGDPIATDWVWVAENVLRGSTWPVTISPQNRALDERIGNVVFERNLVLPDEYSATLTNQMVEVVAHDVTIRGNVFVGSDRSPDLLAVAVEEYPLVPAPARVRVLENTFLQLANRPVTTALLASLRGAHTEGVTLARNLVYAPNARSAPTAILATDAVFPIGELRESGDLLYAPYNTVWAWIAARPVSLAIWQSLDVGGGPFGGAALCGDPGFARVRQLDLTLPPSSPALSGGIVRGAPPEVARLQHRVLAVPRR